MDPPQWSFCAREKKNWVDCVGQMEVVAGPRSPIRSPPHLGSIMERGSLHEDEDRDILTPLRNLGSPKNRRPPVREGTPVDRIRCRSDSE